MRIEIKTKKMVLGTGELGRRILAIKALGRDKLPAEYMTGEPKIWKDPSSPTLWTGAGQPCYRDGETVTEAVFQERKAYIEQAGERLAQIRREHKQKALAWNGEETFIV